MNYINVIDTLFYRTLLVVLGLGLLIGPFMDISDYLKLKNGEPATAMFPDNRTKKPLYCSYQRCVVRVKIVPDSLPEFIENLAFDEKQTEQLVNGEHLRIYYYIKQPKRHRVEGEPLPEINWLPALFSVALFSLFGLSLLSNKQTE